MMIEINKLTLHSFYDKIRKVCFCKFSLSFPIYKEEEFSLPSRGTHGF